MIRAIRFDTCGECPFLHRGGLAGCIVVGGSFNGHRTYRWVRDLKGKEKDCPYPKGVIIHNCKECPYQEDKFCNRIKERSLVPISDLGGFHEDCPLEVLKNTEEK